MRAPDKIPVSIAVNSSFERSVKFLPTNIHPAQASPPLKIIITASTTYDLKFFLKLPKKFGPAIKPTAVTKRISPRLSTIFSALVTKSVLISLDRSL